MEGQSCQEKKKRWNIKNDKSENQYDDRCYVKGVMCQKFD